MKIRGRTANWIYQRTVEEGRICSGPTKNRRFIPTAPDQLWETDITYVWCGIDRWCYLFNNLDCFTREWLAYVFARDIRRQHAIDCLLKATEGRDLSNLVLRSDNGSQFSSSAFMESVNAQGKGRNSSQTALQNSRGTSSRFTAR
ncbi:MAG: DDE-type integrase/transposase/recombinase [Thermoplasmata archaeon]|nr:DDE-type integrase/transposase/recombinase [Candidatus Sysuiplasma jiujiangense]